MFDLDPNMLYAILTCGVDFGHPQIITKEHIKEFKEAFQTPMVSPLTGEELTDEQVEEVEKIYQWINDNDGKILILIATSGMSEDHPGGNEITSFVSEAVSAERNGYSVETWYGDDSEVLIIGLKTGVPDPIMLLMKEQLQNVDGLFLTPAAKLKMGKMWTPMHAEVAAQVKRLLASIV